MEKFIVRLAFGFAVSCLTCGAAPSAPDRQMIVKHFGDAEFVPVNPAHPDAAQIAVLWGDPANGPSTMLLRMAGATGRLHIHSSDYHLVVIEGDMKHWAQGESSDTAPELGPGSYWFQPRNKAHADSCLSRRCVVFIKWEGQRDVIVAD